MALAAQTLKTVIDATKKSGYEFVGTSAKAFYGIVSAAMGDMEKGIALFGRCDAPILLAEAQTELDRFAWWRHQKEP